jgi:uncharacterized ferritin-like protein (DUF455 family)
MSSSSARASDSNPKSLTKEERRMSRVFVSQPFKVKIRNPDNIEMAELEFQNIDVSKDSFDARVFLNNPSANHDTQTTSENGYAGSLHVFAHGSRCYGGPGHCDIKERQGMYDLRSSHPRALATLYLDVTEKVKEEISKKGDSITVTIVPMLMSAYEMTDRVNVLKFQGLSLNIHSV